MLYTNETFLCQKSKTGKIGKKISVIFLRLLVEFIADFFVRNRQNMKKIFYLLLLTIHSTIFNADKKLTQEQLNACLFSGVTNSYLPTVRHFILLGAQVNCPMENTTPLMRAEFLATQAKKRSTSAQKDCLEIVRALLDAGAVTTEF